MNFFLLQQNNFKIFLPEFFLATSILILTLYSVFIVTSRELNYPILTRNLNKLSILVLVLTLFLVINIKISALTVYQNTFIFDFFSFGIKILILLFSIFFFSISEDSILKNKINNFEYFILILSSILGLMLLVSAYDFLALYLALELQSLCLYVLAASKKDSTFSTEAGLKYFILGSFSSALLLFGISIVYGCTGTTNFGDLALFNQFSIYQPDLFFSIEKGLLLILIAFFFKVAAAPFHMWAPDVYEGAPISSTIFFSIIPKISLFGVFVRLTIVSFNNFYEILMVIFIFVAIFSIVVGSFTALKQKKLKRLMAFSSITHVGYLLLAFSTGSIDGIQSMFFYLIIYMITSLGLWSIILYLDNSIVKDRAKTLVDLISISKVNPALGMSSMILFFSLSGIPPFVGFYAKLSIFLSTIGSSLVYPAIFAILVSVVSSVYYLRLIKIIYFETSEPTLLFKQMSMSLSYSISFAVFSTIFFFINPTFVLLIVQKMTLCLF